MLVLYGIRIGGFVTGKESILILCHKVTAKGMNCPYRAKPGSTSPQVLDELGLQMTDQITGLPIAGGSVAVSKDKAKTPGEDQKYS